MQLTEIRSKLETLAETGATAQEIWDIAVEWAAIRNHTPQSYRPIIDDRLDAFPYVRLTCSELEGGVSALDISEERREIIVNAEHVGDFALAVTGWDDEAFCDDQSFIAVMVRQDWYAWLKEWEVADLEDDTVALLCE